MAESRAIPWSNDNSETITDSIENNWVADFSTQSNKRLKSPEKSTELTLDNKIVKETSKDVTETKKSNFISLSTSIAPIFKVDSLPNEAFPGKLSPPKSFQNSISIQGRPIPQIPTRSNRPLSNLALTSGPAPPLSFSILLTEIWNARFCKGGGTSFNDKPVDSNLPNGESNTLVQQTIRAAIQFTMAKVWLDSLERGCNAPPLTFKLIETSRILNVKPLVQDLNSSSDETTILLSIDSDKLALAIKAAIEPQTSGNTFIRFELAEYVVDTSILQPPISLCSFWRCQQKLTEFQLHYVMRWPQTCLPVYSDDNQTPSEEVLQVTLQVNGQVSKMQSRPTGVWNTDINRAVWKVPLHPPLNATSGRAGDIIRARFECSEGPSTPSPVCLQFVRDNCLASGLILDWTADSLAYPLKIKKQRLMADKYFCDPPHPFSQT